MIGGSAGAGATGAETPEASAPETRGYEIFLEADRRDSGFQDMQVNLQMVLRNTRGGESRRALRVQQLEVPDDGDKILIIFDTPKSIKGTALLSFTHKTGLDDQWLYLPAIGRVKKISSNNQSGPFLGSEFAYEDLTSQEIEKFTYRFLRSEQFGGAPHYVVERIPVGRQSGYTRQIVWLDEAEYRISKIEYFDRRGGHLKTLTMNDYRRYEPHFWKAQRMVMVNHRSGKTTELLWHGYTFSVGLTAERDFTTNSLRRAR
ncbi:MAG: outer membrane lipoprotein-sorting protein [Gammaproteobacteria bacterium]|nr:outer membrane lipoprotein-sorting protein [Gammaproteobacteria bacterium]